MRDIRTVNMIDGQRIEYDKVSKRYGDKGDYGDN